MKILGWKVAGLIVVSALLGCFPATASTANCPPQILAMSYNIRLDTPADGENSWAHRRDFLIGQIRLFRPALLGMQEVLPNQRADLQSSLDGYELVGGGRDDGRLAGEASPIAVDLGVFRIASSGTFWLSPTPQVPSMGWDAAYPRIATWARVTHRGNGTRLLVVNTHWDHVGREARTQSGQLLGQWIRDNRRNNEAVILLGDFNTNDGDAAVVAMLEMAGLQSASDPASAATANTQPSSFNGFQPMPPPGTLIDHIFVGQGIAVVSSLVIAQNLNGAIASDHFPVAARLRLPVRRRDSQCS